MPQPRRSFRAPARAKKLDHKNWELSNGYFSAIAAAASPVALQFSTSASQPATLLRIRGEITAYRDGTTAPPTAVLVSYGIILVPEGTGTTPLFDPFIDANAPWLLYGQGLIAYEEAVSDVVDVPVVTGFRHVIDNKAMRIIRPDVEMQFVLANTTQASTSSINLNYGLRWLLGY